LHVSAVCDHSYRIEAITNNLPGALVDTEPGDFEDLMEMVVLKKDFKNSMGTISQRLEQIPHDLDAHEVVLKNDFAIMGDNLRHEIVKDVGTVFRLALTRTVLAPTLEHSVDIRVPFLPSTPPGLVTQIWLPNGLNSSLPTGYAMQAPMGTVMTQRAMSMLASPVMPTTTSGVSRNLLYGPGVPSAPVASVLRAHATAFKPLVMKIISKRDPATLGLKLRDIEIGAVVWLSSCTSIIPREDRRNINGLR
jgi:hypothetical protein